MKDVLKVGDIVVWFNGYGTDRPRLAEVLEIEYWTYPIGWDKPYKNDMDDAYWSDVTDENSSDKYHLRVRSLDNKRIHTALGNQISPVTDDLRVLKFDTADASGDTNFFLSAGVVVRQVSNEGEYIIASTLPSRFVKETVSFPLYPQQYIHAQYFPLE